MFLAMSTEKGRDIKITNLLSGIIESLSPSSTYITIVTIDADMKKYESAFFFFIKAIKPVIISRVARPAMIVERPFI
jgi:hypothetical protein